MTQENIPTGACCLMRLEQFHKNNKHAHVLIDTSQIEVHNLWSVSGLQFNIKIDDDDGLRMMNDIVVNSHFDAIINSKLNRIEFIFTFADTEKGNEPWINRSFTVVHKGKEYNCHFSRSSEGVMLLAKSMERSPDEENRRVVPQLRMFRDYQRLEQAPEHIRSYFQDKTPISFYVDGDFGQPFDFIKFAQFLNITTAYYDRNAPVILVRQDDVASGPDAPGRVKMGLSNFPHRINLPEIDEVILTLLESARNTSPRFAFIYYYQIFEYAGFYYLDQKLKAEARRIILDPAFAGAAEETISELLSILSDRNHNDDVRMSKVIEELCSPEHSWPEVKNDLEFFSSIVEFDGGFQLQPLIHKEITPEAWKSQAQKILPSLTKLRNCIVHARERRENRVVLPTKHNNRQIARVLPLIRRMAEDIAMHV